jgi:hypothetical protein
MGLNELLEKESIKSISQRTMISEANIERIVSEDYSGITKAKALGFLSILEREYQLDLKDVRNNALVYFEMQAPEEIVVNIALPRVEEKKGRSKWFLFMMLGLLGYASWYFFTQFDKKTLNTLMPFSTESNKTQDVLEEKDSIFSVAINEETTKDVEMTSEVVSNENVAVVQKKVETVESTEESNKSVTVQPNVTVVQDEDKTVTVVVTDNNTSVLEKQNPALVESTTSAQSIKVAEANNSTLENQTEVSESVDENVSTTVAPKAVEVTKAVLKPVKRLWFGLVNMRTGKRDHFSIRKPFTIDLSKGDWLVATSPAPFSLLFKGKTYTYNNGREHYFMITKEGITPLKKRAYVRKGGYRKW